MTKHSILRSPCRFEILESRCVLASIFPAYVDGVFTLGNPSLGAPYGRDNTFELASNPSATKTIYLDFDGYHSVNNRWGHDIVFPAYNTNGAPGSFSIPELNQIQKMFQIVAEDFAPFDVNVTTKEPPLDWLIRSNASDQFYGVRSVQTQATDGFGSGIGGVAYLNSFDDNADNPVFAFNKGVTNGGMTISHEVGHALGLSHDGLGPNTYHPGTGSGATGWGPIMGAPFGMNVTQWSDGDYTNSTNREDDLAIITKAANGFGYQADDHGNDELTATSLLSTGSSAFDWGIIERNTDVDFFQFTTGASGSVSVRVNAFGEDPNLDVELTVTDSSGNLVGTDNLTTAVNASLSFATAGDTYFVKVDGVGLPGRYTDYGSMGFYSIDVTGLVTGPSGDFDQNGLLTVNDLDLLMEDIYLFGQGGGNPATFDLTGDNAVDLQDRDAWLATAGAANLPSGLPYLVGDANLDGSVDGSDFSIWNASKFTVQTAWSAGNFSGDSLVDGSDFSLWNTNRFLSSSMRPADVPSTDGALGDMDGKEPAFWPFGHPADSHDHEHIAIAATRLSPMLPTNPAQPAPHADLAIESERLDRLAGDVTRARIQDRLVTADDAHRDDEPAIGRWHRATDRSEDGGDDLTFRPATDW